MLGSRSIMATLSGEIIDVSATKGCPQGVFYRHSCGAWLDRHLGELNEGSYYAIGYADDIAILINGKFPDSLRGTANIPRTGKAVV
jgi:hypothetical protein